MKLDEINMIGCLQCYFFIRVTRAPQNTSRLQKNEDRSQKICHESDSLGRPFRLEKGEKQNCFLQKKK